MKRVLFSISVMVSLFIMTAITLADPPANDSCYNADNAGTLTSGQTEQLTGTTDESTDDCSEVTGSEVWVKFTLASCMDVTIDFCDHNGMVPDFTNYLYDTCPCDGEHYVSVRENCNGEWDTPSYTWYSLDAGTYYCPIQDMFVSGDYTVNITGTNCPAAPDNDDCADAVSIGDVSDYSFTTRGASFDGEGSCLTSPNVWYIYSPTFTGTARLTISADYTDKYAIYDGSSCSPLPTQLVCSAGSQSEFDVVSGSQYLIEIGGYNNQEGTGTMTIGEAPAAPSNDNCEDADDAGTLTSGQTEQLTGTVAEATNDCSNNGMEEVWVKFTITNCMDVTIDLCDDNSTFDDFSTELYSECPCDDNPYSGDMDHCDNFNPSLTWTYLPAGTYYYPILSMYFMESDTYTINVTGVDCPAGPDNDDCSSATVINEVADQSFTTVGASFDGEGTCLTSANVWYYYVATFTGTAEISFTTDYSHQFAVYDGGDCSPLGTELGCTDNSSMDFDVTSGNAYLIEIGGSGTASGNGTFTVAEAPDRPANDDCVDATDLGTLISGANYQQSGDATNATEECANNPEVWIKFTVANCMDVTIDFCDDENSQPGYTTLHSGCPCIGGYDVDSDSTCENNNPIYIWNGLTAGTYYYPILNNQMGDGTYVVNVKGVNCPAPDNDDCGDAIAIGEVTEIEFTTLGASFDGEGDCLSSPNVWYVYTPTFTGDARVTLVSDYNDQFAVYNGASCSPISTELVCSADAANSTMDFAVTAGQDYLIEIGGDGSDIGSGVMTVGEAIDPVPENDDCANAFDNGTLITNISYIQAGTVAYATQDCEQNDGPEVWVMFTISEAQDIVVNFGWNDSLVNDMSSKLYDDCPCGDAYNANLEDTTDNGNPSRQWYNIPAGTYYYPVEASGLTIDYYAVVVKALTATVVSGYEYLPGDANMAAETWPAQTIGGDVTYLVNYFRGLADPCKLDGFYASADATGDCMVVGGDVTYLVNYFRGLNELSYCNDYEPAWPTPSDVPADAPDGWPNCDSSTD